MQEEGSSAQESTSTGLRNTRTTARQREVSEGGRSNARKPELLRKTHLAGCAPERAAFETSIPAVHRCSRQKKRPGRARNLRLRSLP